MKLSFLSWKHLLRFGASEGLRVSSSVSSPGRVAGTVSRAAVKATNTMRLSEGQGQKLTWYVLSKLSYMNRVIRDVFPTVKQEERGSAVIRAWLL